MKKLIPLFLFLLMQFCAKAQQDPEYTMYMFNMMSINPAYAGTKDHADVTLLGRKQWVSYPGAPQTISFNIHTPFYYEKMGAGLSVINDKLGVMNYNVINLAYSYHLKFKKSALSFGVQPSFQQMSSSQAGLKIDAPGATPVADNAFQNIVQSNFKLGAGAFWYNNKGYLGVSSPLVATVKLSGPGGSVMPYKSTTHLFIAGGYVFNLGSEDYVLKPSTLLKYTNGAPLEFDLNCNLYIHSVFGIGVSWRSFDSMDAILEYQINKNFKIAYAYDYTLTNLGNYNSGSHELMLNWQFGFKKGKIITPRYF